MEKNNFKIIILAGGKGKRMQSDLPKALSPLNGKYMIQYLLDSIKEFTKEKPIIVIGHLGDLIKKELKNNYIYVNQPEPLGTGHAVMCTKKNCRQTNNLLILSSDQPFITPETLKNLYLKHISSKAKITFTTTTLPDFENWHKSFIAFGRILRKKEKILGIKEYKDAKEAEKKIKEVNAGCYIFNAKWLWNNLKKIKNNNIQNEYYLTDLIKIAMDENEKIETIQIEPKEALGANTKEELETLEKFAKK